MHAHGATMPRAYCCHVGNHPKLAVTEARQARLGEKPDRCLVRGGTTLSFIAVLLSIVRMSQRRNISCSGQMQGAARLCASSLKPSNKQDFSWIPALPFDRCEQLLELRLRTSPNNASCRGVCHMLEVV